MHAGQLAITARTVRALIEEQFPQWRDLRVHRVSSSGTVHAIFRIGDRLAARFRLQIGDVESVWCELRMEADAAREIAGCTRFPTPEPLAIGAPGRGYPMPWLIQTWLDGTVAIERDPGESVVFATELAEFITDVRHIDTHGRRYSGYGRGGVLAAHDEWIQECLTRSDGLLNVAVLRRIWETMRALPRGDSPDVMNHGDLLPGNLLVHNGRLAGVLDVGGLAAADPALDLVSAWHLLDREPRRVMRECLDVGDAEWERGKAWAFQQAMGAVWYYVNSNPQFSQVGRRTLHRICAESR
ncbi:aminoglycoside phosphotransferase family protein [Mycolicibacterium goodii]|uniref:Aminoglycoside phosphotransferase family protein n=1 Tax=Mycolicibacterium goodii TaxID=134601 RepID=A0ABS6HME9_MYCGD|nr:aminoglycoside phosphotransferase family protein [Mycolicibacterium goodii]MBU8823877.1 aminoglycoside phosphotransferase family protein [Mycolicibacterium goodii]MBU8836522.1 aminoglycoside phosphotransferase family protein [Mycolicibacterium goodii]OKH70729.1 aminoglycoside phosphotransferase [Mycobacterium sp. SWH-M5]